LLLLVIIQPLKIDATLVTYKYHESLVINNLMSSKSLYDEEKLKIMLNN